MKKKKINQAADNVMLDYPDKAAVIASAAREENITASGYDTAVYKIEYKAVTSNATESNRNVCFENA